MIFDWPDFYEERAAIREYLGNLDRFSAEKLAYIETQKAFMAQENCDKNHAIIELTKLDILNPSRKAA